MGYVHEELKLKKLLKMLVHMPAIFIKVIMHSNGLLMQPWRRCCYVNAKLHHMVYRLTASVCIGCTANSSPAISAGHTSLKTTPHSSTYR